MAAVKPFDDTAMWIWCEGGNWNPSSNPDSPFRGCRFRRSFDVSDPGDTELIASVSADTQYVLYCNGEVVRRGPAKGDVDHQFYDTVDLSDHLRQGANIVAAEVVSYAPAWGGPHSRMTKTNAFILDGAVQVDGEVTETIHTDEDWRAEPDEARGHERRPGRAHLAGADERMDGRKYPDGWTRHSFDDSSWRTAVELDSGTLRGEDDIWHHLPYRLVDRTIPPLEERHERFDAPYNVEGIDPHEVTMLVENGESLEVPAGESVSFVADAGRNTTGYPFVAVTGGAGAKISLTYAEGWSVDGEKTAVHDPEQGEIAGHSDEYVCREGEQSYEPLRWRGFRYIRVDVEAADEAVHIDDLSYTFTAYPYEERASFDSSDDITDRIWDVSWRTVQLCSHSTFEDCPYYEQLQYAGDTQPVMQFAGYVSGDWRLGRQAVRHFDWSRDSSGLSKSRYPSRVPQTIPSWSLLWVVMVRDYWWHTADGETAAAVLNGVDATLHWFTGYLEDDLVTDIPGWKCVDWVPEWEAGVPPGAIDGSSTIISLQYAAALRAAAEVHDAVGDPAKAKDHRWTADRVIETVNDRCWDSDRGLYLDRPNGTEVSQHANAWAVLSGAAGGERAARVAERIVTDMSLSQATLYCRFYVFRALSEAGVYNDLAGDILDDWERYLEGTDLTTWPERPPQNGSFCHAWSSSPLYEYLAEVCGVKPASPGFESIRAAPSPLGLEWANGTIPTPQGDITVEWRRGDEALKVTVKTPRGVSGTIELPDGSETSITAKTTRTTAQTD